MLRRSALIAVLISAACFGTLAIITSLAYRAGAEPMPLLVWRFAVAALALAGYLAITNPGALRVSASDLARYVVVSVFGYGAASMCFFHALKFADASVVAVLLYTYPAMVVVVERVINGERLTRGKLTGVVATFAGTVLVLGLFSGTGVSAIGILLGLGAAVGYTVFTILLHRWLPGRSRIAMMMYLFATNSVFMAVIALVSGVNLSPVSWSVEAWVYVLALVAVPTVAAVVLYMRGISSLGAGQASIVSTSEPVFTIFLASLFLGERLTVVQLIGAVLVIVGVLIAERSAGRVEEIAAV
ncbi:MAG: DMT family transporter [Actinomycetota bacterium]|nr:DMT family transporter [Actinomycetota bacterium]